MRLRNSVAGAAAVAGFMTLAGHAGAATCDKPAAKTGNSTLPGAVVYFTGSSAAKPMLKQVSTLLANLQNPIRLVYQSVGSCQGLSDITTSTKEPTTGTYWDDATSAAQSTSTRTHRHAAPRRL